MEKIACQLCGAEVHSIQIHIRDEHPEYSADDYKADYPGAPMLSDAAKAKLAENRYQAELKHINTATVTPIKADGGESMVAMNTLFALGRSKAAMASNGNPIMITQFGRGDGEDYIPEIDEGFVYDIDTLKNILLGIDLNIPTLLWGHAGTGKSSFVEQICARTNRSLTRVQHTINTEESHIVGQWTVKDSQTHFELGPLAVAMKEGHVYMADEYDFCLPSVLSVYQSVLEGKSLMIKEADEANRIIKPHPNFHFIATGNTNGSGDETGLYQGTNMQNAANYDRFGVVCKVNYMSKKMEEKIIVNQSDLDAVDAKKLVEFATSVRQAYDAGKISSTISPRALINAAKVGIRRGSLTMGINLAFANKLTMIDKEVCEGMSQRILGGEA